MSDAGPIYLRLAIIGAGLADGLLFGHVTGPVTALVLLGIFDMCILSDARSKQKPKIEDEIQRQIEEARTEHRPQERAGS
jgi:hypothetical protein